MADVSKLRSAVIEKQELILNKLTAMTYVEVMQLMASLSAIISNLDKVQAEEEGQCNRLLVAEMTKDARTTFSKADAILKCSDTYQSYKNIMSLKQCSVRAMNLARLHAHYLLKSAQGGDESLETNDDAG